VIVAAILNFPTSVDFPKFFTVAFLPTHVGLHLYNNFCDTDCPANSPILNTRLPDYTIALSNTYVYAVVYTFTVLWHVCLVNNLLIVAFNLHCTSSAEYASEKIFEILSIFDTDMDISVMSPLYRLAVF